MRHGRAVSQRAASQEMTELMQEHAKSVVARRLPGVDNRQGLGCPNVGGPCRERRHTACVVERGRRAPTAARRSYERRREESRAAAQRVAQQRRRSESWCRKTCAHSKSTEVMHRADRSVQSRAASRRGRVRTCNQGRRGRRGERRGERPGASTGSQRTPASETCTRVTPPWGWCPP